MNDINPIKDVIDLPIITRAELIFLIIFGLLVVFILLIWLFFKYGRKYFFKEKVKAPEEIVQVDFREELNNKIREAKKLLEHYLYKDFHLKIAEALKFFLEKKYDFQAQEMTGQEIIESIKLPVVIKEQVQEFFHKNDLAKFAGLGLEKQVAEEVLKILENMIEG